MFFLSSCGDSCNEYSDFSCKEIDNAEYNVYFYLGQKELYLGQANGLAACGSIAWNKASSLSMDRGDDWGYICCMIAKGSSCYEKHR